MWCTLKIRPLLSRIGIPCLVGAVLAGSLNAAQAQEIGVAAVVRNDVAQVSPPAPINVGSKLFANERVRTGQDSAAKRHEVKPKLAAIFKTKTRAEWTALMEQKDVCFAPVLTMNEAMKHHHNVARGTFVTVDGVPQPGPAPRFARTPSAVPRGPAHAGEHSAEVLSDWGFDKASISALIESGAVRQR